MGSLRTANVRAVVRARAEYFNSKLSSAHTETSLCWSYACQVLEREATHPQLSSKVEQARPAHRALLGGGGT